MTLYVVLFLLGFILAIGLLAYATMQMTELSKKAESFNASLVARYSKPLKNLVAEQQDMDKDKEKKEEEEA